MSAATPNFFGVLGEEASVAVCLNATPTTAESTSSRKVDVNPKADPSKARKRAPGAPSNDKILKESKDAGRSNNRRVPVKEGAATHHSRRSERTDRIPRTAKRDTAKRERSGWGDENSEPNDQLAAAEIAQADIREEAEEAEESAKLREPAEPTLTLEQFHQQQREQNAGLNTRKSSHTSRVEAPPVAIEIKSTVPESRRKQTTKPRKEIQTLSLDSSVVPALQQQANGVMDPAVRRAERSEERPRRDTDRRAPRGDHPAERAPRAPRASRGDGVPRGDGERRPRPARKLSDKPEGKKDGKPSATANKSKPKAPRAPKSILNISELPKLN